MLRPRVLPLGPVLREPQARVLLPQRATGLQLRMLRAREVCANFQPQLLLPSGPAQILPEDGPSASRTGRRASRGPLWRGRGMRMDGGAKVLGGKGAPQWAVRRGRGADATYEDGYATCSQVSLAVRSSLPARSPPSPRPPPRPGRRKPAPEAFVAIAIQGVTIRSGGFVWGYQAQLQHTDSGFTKDLSGTTLFTDFNTSQDRARQVIISGHAPSHGPCSRKQVTMCLWSASPSSCSSATSATCDRRVVSRATAASAPRQCADRARRPRSHGRYWPQ